MCGASSETLRKDKAMRITKYVVLVLVVLGLSVPAWSQEKGADHTDMKHEMKEMPSTDPGMDHSKMDHSKMETTEMEVSGAKEATGTGVINSVDADGRSINITHDPMPEFGWPKMTMDLATTKKVDLSNVKEGDKVEFKLKLGRDKKFRVIEMESAQEE